MLFILGGLCGIVFAVVTQFLIKLLIEPFHEFRKEIGHVRFVLMKHGPAIHTPIGRNRENTSEAQDDIQTCSASLIAKLQAVQWYPLFKWFAALPPESDVDRAAALLRGLSNYVIELDPSVAMNELDTVLKRVSKIENLLHLRSVP